MILDRDKRGYYPCTGMDEGTIRAPARTLKIYIYDVCINACM